MRIAPWFWSRPLRRAEIRFVRRFFGASLDARLPQLRVYLRRLGDTRRALALPGGRISMPRQAFVQGDPQRPLALHQPAVAGLWAHELLHQWQAQQGRAVTREAAWLQLQALCLGRDVYAYAACADAGQMLARFLAAQVEQQGQMWQDHVQRCVAGQPDAAFAAIAAHVAAHVAQTTCGH